MRLEIIIPFILILIVAIIVGPSFYNQLIHKDYIFVPYDCTSIKNDSAGYLFKICNYLNSKNISFAPRGKEYGIREIRETNNTIEIMLDCCYAGDWATINKQTGEVMSFHLGPV